jgi:uncharacterized protein
VNVYKMIRTAGFMGMLALAACSSIPPTFYTLDDAAGRPLGQGKSPSVAITQVTVAEMLDRPQMVTRNGNQIHFSEQNRWAEPLKYSLPRVMADELGRALDSSQVVAMPANLTRFDPDFRVQIDLQRFEVADGVAEADALWRIESRQGKITIQRIQAREAVTQSGAEAQVVAQRKALARIAADIAAAIRRESGAAR